MFDLFHRKRSSNAPVGRVVGDPIESGWAEPRESRLGG